MRQYAAPSWLWNNTRPMLDRHFLIALVAGLIALVAGVVAYRDLSAPEQPLSLVSGTALGAQARPMPEFTLVDHAGKTFDSTYLVDRWTFMFFGYTHCPDICPTTLATLDKTIDELQSRGASAATQVVFISVDPERDSPQRLSEYVKYFNATFTGATGDAAELGRLALALGIP